MTREEVLKLGFEEIPHFTVTNALSYDLGRNRSISYGCIGTPNEMLWICQTLKGDIKKMTDLICLHNYDYDGYLSLSKLKQIIKVLR